MNTMKKNHPSALLETGNAILAAAQVVDTTLISSRLTAFAEAHQSYAEAQRKVVEAEAHVEAEQGVLSRLDRKQENALEGVARALIFDGQPRANPFAPFGMEAPSLLKRLSFGEQAKAIHTLVAAIQNVTTVSPTTHAALQVAEQAASKMDTALPPVEALRHNLRELRHARDVIANKWEATHTALRNGARYADDEGAHGLYAALFGRKVRTRRSKATPAPQPAAQPTTAAA